MYHAATVHCVFLQVDLNTKSWNYMLLLLNFLPLSSDGEGVLLSSGVARYSSNANLQDCLAIVHHLIRPFIVLMDLSAKLAQWWHALENDKLIPR